MGGGDLNLKKSWHPSTLRNIERVWKAEQKHEAEKQKIEQLQKELAEERAREEIQSFAEDQGVVKKKEEKLDWMYQGPAAMMNRDEYLLGKKIDKTFETMQLVETGKAPEADSDVTTSVFNSQDLSGTATVDLANKIREDPLFNIMKKEKEQRKNLLTNPVKMKQLQQMLKASLSEKPKKKNKKSKKKKHQESNSDDEVPQKRKKHKKHHRSSDEEEDTHMFPKEIKKSSKTKHPRESSPEFREYRERNSYKHQSKHSDSSSPVHRDFEEYDSYKHRNKYSDSSFDTRSNHNNSRSYPPHKDSNFNRNHRYDEEYSDRRQKERYNNSSRQNYEKDSRQSHSSSKPREYTSHKYNHQNNGSSHYQGKSDMEKELDSNETERLLQEMQENAKWREKQRKINTDRYKEEDERENNVKRVDASDFLKPMLSKAAGKGSLENRVKQKIFSIQRSSAAMDKHFARRE